MILFETSSSVFELMWDIALALFIARLAFYYFGLLFLTGAVITYFRVTRLIPVNHLTQPQSEIITLPFFLIATVLWARFIVVNFEVPRVAGFRLAIGILGTILMVIAELLVGVVMYEEGWSAWIWETDPVAGGASAAVLLLFGLMPSILMLVEKKPAEVDYTYHGHEKKPITAAVPTVAKVDKKAPRRRKTNGKKTN